MPNLTIYILYSSKRELFYVGKTSNLEKRLLQHNNGESKFTKSGIPWHLIWFRSFSDVEEAENLEKKLKNLSRSRKIKFANKYAASIQDSELLNQIENENE